MKQINSFMSEIPDDFKVVVVDAIKALCIKVCAKEKLSERERVVLN